jgi:hypothetical protein
MKNKIKTWLVLISFIIIASCIGDDKVDKLNEKYIPELSNNDIQFYKSTENSTDTFYISINQYQDLISDNHYCEVVSIYYSNENVDNPDLPGLYQSVDFFHIWIVSFYDRIVMAYNSLDNVSFEHMEFNQSSDSYHQNGHIYPDVYTFEMDTVTAMENWDTTMNLFPDVRKVWYSLSRGIVRYDMKDGESYKLVE